MSRSRVGYVTHDGTLGYPVARKDRKREVMSWCKPMENVPTNSQERTRFIQFSHRILLRSIHLSSVSARQTSVDNREAGQAQHPVVQSGSRVNTTVECRGTGLRRTRLEQSRLLSSRG